MSEELFTLIFYGTIASGVLLALGGLYFICCTAKHYQNGYCLVESFERASRDLV